MIPPKRFDIFPLTGECSEGLDVFRFFFKNLVFLARSSIGEIAEVVHFIVNTAVMLMMK